MFTDEKRKLYRTLIAQKKGVTLTEGTVNMTVENLLKAFEERIAMTRVGKKWRDLLAQDERVAINTFIDEVERKETKRSPRGYGSYNPDAEDRSEREEGHWGRQ